MVAFLHYNAHNEMFTGTDEYYYHNVNFKNIDTGRTSRIFREDSLYFFPKVNDRIMPNNIMNVLKIDRRVKCIKVNENGLFIENFDLEGNILTQYYDMAALSELSSRGFSAGNIDYIEDRIEDIGILPDRIISINKKDENLELFIVENGEVIRKGKAPVDDSRTMYSIYYEFMKIKNYYGNDVQQVNKSGLRR